MGRPFPRAGQLHRTSFCASQSKPDQYFGTANYCHSTFFYLRGDNLALGAAGIRAVRVGGGGNYREIRKGRAEVIAVKIVMRRFTLVFSLGSASIHF